MRPVRSGPKARGAKSVVLVLLAVFCPFGHAADAQESPRPYGRLLCPEHSADWMVWLDQIDPAWSQFLAPNTPELAWEDWKGLSTEASFEAWEARLTFVPGIFWHRPGRAIRLLAGSGGNDLSLDLQALLRNSFYGPPSLVLADWLLIRGARAAAVDVLLTEPMLFEHYPDARTVPRPDLGAWSGYVRAAQGRFRLAAFGSSALLAQALPLLRTARQLEGAGPSQRVRPSCDGWVAEILQAERLYWWLEPYIWPLGSTTPWKAFDIVAACEGLEIAEGPTHAFKDRPPLPPTVHEDLLSKPEEQAAELLRQVGELKSHGRQFLPTLVKVAVRRPALAPQAAAAAARVIVEIPDAARYADAARTLFLQADRTRDSAFGWRRSMEAVVLAHYLQQAEALEVLRRWTRNAPGRGQIADELLYSMPELHLFAVLLDRVTSQRIDPDLAREIVEEVHSHSRLAVFLLPTVATPWVERDPTLIERVNTLVAVRIAGRLAGRQAWARAYLARALDDARPAVRVEAALQLLKPIAQWPERSELLARRLVREPNERVALVLQDVLAEVGSASEARYLAATLEKQPGLAPGKQCELIRSIAVIRGGAQAALPVLARLSGSSELMVAVTATRALGSCDQMSDSLLTALRRAAADDRWPVRAAAATAAGKLGSQTMLDVWTELLSDPVTMVRLAAAGSVERFAGDPGTSRHAARALAKALREAKDLSLALQCYRAFHRLQVQEEGISKAIVDSARGTSGSVAAAAARALAASLPERLLAEYRQLLTTSFEARKTPPSDEASYPFELAALVELARRDPATLRQLASWASKGRVPGNLLGGLWQGVPQPYNDPIYRQIIQGRHGRVAIWRALDHPPTTDPQVVAILRQLAFDDTNDPEARILAIALLGHCARVTEAASRVLVRLLASDDQAIAAAAARALADPQLKLDVTALLESLTGPAVKQRQRAASVFWELARGGMDFDATTVQALQEHLRTEDDLTVRSLIAAALTTATGDPAPCIGLLPQVYRAGSVHQAWCLLSALADTNVDQLEPSVRTLLSELARHPHPRLSGITRRLLHQANR